MRATVVGVVACLVVAGAGRARPAPPLSFEPYVIRGFDGVERPAELGRLKVPARHAQADGEVIEVAVVRLGTTATSPADPIVFLMGGPGIPASVMARVPVYAQLFDRLRAVADVVLVDQRGTGLSRPLLDCPLREAPLGPGAFERQATLFAEMRTELSGCVAAWRARGVDLAAYTSVEIAGDVAALRQPLEARRLNLLAFSYGTEVALTVMRRHREAVAHAVLAGVRGPDHVLKLPSVFEVKVRQVSRLAAERPALANVLQGPDDLVARLERVLGAAATPLRVRIDHPHTKEPVELRVGREGLQMVFLHHVDSVRFPALVLALERGDTRVLARVLAPLYTTFSRGGSSLMARAVNCSTGASPVRTGRATAEAVWTLLGLPFEDRLVSAEYCGALGTIERDAASWRPFASDVPTLFISGSLDSNTPPAQAEEVRYGFRHAAHLVVENGGHETLPLRGVQDAVVDFFRGTDLAGRRLTAELPTFMTVEEAASQPCGPRGC
jgi:pimeloyl-ACP methyl ester carboxylesterase